MIHLVRKTSEATAAEATLTLDFQQRSKSRIRATLDNDDEVAITLDRGTRILPGDMLESEQGYVVCVRAADEKVSVVKSPDSHLLARACYHLGNRHVAVQIEPQELRYLHDHVLDDMIRLLGLSVETEQLPFEPESGAYGDHAHIQDHHH